jgi:hypothetical protein
MSSENRARRVQHRVRRSDQIAVTHRLNIALAALVRGP